MCKSPNRIKETRRDLKILDKTSQRKAHNPGCSSNLISADRSSICTDWSSQSLTISSIKVVKILEWLSLDPKPEAICESSDRLRLEEYFCFHRPWEGNTTSCSDFTPFGTEEGSFSWSSKSWRWDCDRRRVGAARPESREMRFSSTWRRGASRMQSLRSSGLICDELDGLRGSPSQTGIGRGEVIKVITKFTDRTRLSWITGRHTSAYSSLWV